MSKEDNFLPRIRFHYHLDPEVRLQTAHGVWGGINPHGEVEMSFYHESDALPKVSEHIVAPDGSLEHEVTGVDNDAHNIIRHVHTRVLLNYDTARAVLEWLENRIDELEQELQTGIHHNGIEQ